MENFIDKTVVFIGQNKIGKNVTILPYCVIENSEIQDDCTIGPFAHIRPNCIIKKGSKIGNFCEIKNSVIGKNCAISHMSYVGDATIGNFCNIGAGTIFCNYNGKQKFRSEVGNNCFIGSNSTIIAPITIGNNCFIAGGSTLRKSLTNNTFFKQKTYDDVRENLFTKD